MRIKSMVLGNKKIMSESRSRESISGIIGASIRSLFGAKRNSVADQPVENTPLVPKQSKKLDASREGDVLPVLCWSNDKARSLPDFKRADLEIDSREYVDQNIDAGHFLYQKGQLGGGISVDLAPSLCSNRVARSTLGETSSCISKEEGLTSEKACAISIKELASPKVTSKTVPNEVITLGGMSTIGDGMNKTRSEELLAISSASKLKQRLSVPEGFPSSPRKLSEHVLGSVSIKNIIPLVQNILECIVKIDEIVSEKQRGVEGGVTDRLFPDHLKCTINNIKEYFGIEEVGGKRTRDIINITDDTRTRYPDPDSALSGQDHLWDWNLDICRVTETEDEFLISFDSTKECYQKTHDTQKVFNGLVDSSPSQYVFVLTKNKEASDIDLEDERTQRLLNIQEYLKCGLNRCVEIMLVEKNFQDKLGTIFKKLSSIRKKQYLFLMMGTILEDEGRENNTAYQEGKKAADAQRKEDIKKVEDYFSCSRQKVLGIAEVFKGLKEIIPENPYNSSLPRQCKSLEDLEKNVMFMLERKYNERLSSLNKKVLELNQKHDSIWKMLFEHIVEGNNEEIRRGIELECFEFAFSHITLSSARVVLDKVFGELSFQDKKENLDVLLDCFILGMNDYCEMFSGRKSTVAEQTSGFYSDRSSAYMKQEQCSQGKVKQGAKNSDSVEPSFNSRGEFSFPACLEDKDSCRGLEELIEKYEDLQKSPVLKRTVREILNCMETHKGRLEKLFDDLEKDNIDRDIVALHQRFISFIDCLYLQEKFIKKIKPRLFFIIDQIKSLIKKVPTSAMNLLWSNEKSDFSVRHEILLFCFLFRETLDLDSSYLPRVLDNVSISPDDYLPEKIVNQILFHKMMRVVAETLCRPENMTDIELKGEKLFFKKCKDINTDIFFDFLSNSGNIWMDDYFAEIWIDQSPCVQKFFMYCFLVKDSTSSLLLDDEAVAKRILFQDTLDLKMLCAEYFCFRLRFAINDLQSSSEEKEKLTEQVDCLASKCCDENVLSRRVDGVRDKKDAKKLEKERIKAWLEILKCLENMDDNSFFYNRDFYFSVISIQKLYSYNKRELIKYFYGSDFDKKKIEIGEKLNIGLNFCDAFLTQYIPLQSNVIPIEIQSILMKDITHKIMHIIASEEPIDGTTIDNVTRFIYKSDMASLERWKKFFNISGILEAPYWKEYSYKEKIVFLCCFVVQKDSAFLREIYKECVSAITGESVIIQNDILSLLGCIVRLKIRYLLCNQLGEKNREDSIHYRLYYDFYCAVTHISTQDILGNNNALLRGARKIRDLISFFKKSKRILEEAIPEPIEIVKSIIDELDARDIFCCLQRMFQKHTKEQEIDSAVVFYCYWKLLQSDKSPFFLLCDRDEEIKDIWNKDNTVLYWKIASENNKKLWIEDAYHSGRRLEEFLPFQMVEAEKVAIKDKIEREERVKAARSIMSIVSEESGMATERGSIASAARSGMTTERGSIASVARSGVAIERESIASVARSGMTTERGSIASVARSGVAIERESIASAARSGGAIDGLEVQGNEVDELDRAAKIVELNMNVTTALETVLHRASVQMDLCGNTEEDRCKRNVLDVLIQYCGDVNEACVQLDSEGMEDTLFNCIRTMRNLLNFVRENKLFLDREELSVPFDMLDEFFKTQELSVLLSYWNEFKESEELDWVYCYIAYQLQEKTNNSSFFVKLKNLDLLHEDKIKSYNIDSIMKEWILLWEADWSYDCAEKVLFRGMSMKRRVIVLSNEQWRIPLKKILKSAVRVASSDAQVGRHFRDWRDILVKKMPGMSKGVRGFFMRLFFLLWPFFKALVNGHWRFAMNLIRRKSNSVVELEKKDEFLV